MTGILAQIVFMIIGFTIMVKGADWFVDGAAAFAERLGIPHIIVGLTIVAMGTSAPEAAVSITSSLQGSEGITIGNVVGSNIINILLILGVTSVISALAVEEKTIRREMPFMIAVTVLLLIFGITDYSISFAEGIVFWIVFAAFLAVLIAEAKKGCSGGVAMAIADESGDESRPVKLPRLLLYGLIGLVGIILGSDLTVDSATELARIFGISERFIGLTIVAFGTSLPELVTCIAAALKKEADIAVGNIVGSNIFNILFVCGTTALINPIGFEPDFVSDTLAAVFAAVLLLILSVKGRKISRIDGIIMLTCYAVYFVCISF